MPAAHTRIEFTTNSPPKPFRGFAVRSEEARHAFSARKPYGCVHHIRTNFLSASALNGLATLGRSRMQLSAFSDIDYSLVSLAELAQAASGVEDLVGHIAAALQLTGVMGDAVADYRQAVAARIDFLAAYGAGFHNDVKGHWTACLFWNLALEMSDIEFVMPHASVRVALLPGDLIVFDQTLAHGLCRPRDGGQALAATFTNGAADQQIFLSGELLLSDAQWAAAGAPWLPVDDPQHAGALELMAAEFDEQSGAIKRPQTLAHCMQRSTVYADPAA